MTALAPTPPTHDTAAPHGLLVANLVALLAFGLLSMTICIPSMQVWGAQFGASQARVQLSFSGFVVAYGGMQLLYGPLSDRLGRKRVLMAGLALGGLGSVLAALAPGLDALIAARVLQGAGSAAGMVVGRALVQDLFAGPERTRVMAYIGMAMGLCPPAATVIGGQLHVRLGWQANFVAMALLAAVLLVLSWRVLPGRASAAAPGGAAHWLQAMGRAYARLAREPVFLCYVGILAMTTATFYVFLGGAPIVLSGYGVGPDGIGYYIMCTPLAYIVGNYATTRLVHRFGERRMMAAGQAITMGSLVLLLALGLAGLNTPLALALPLVGLGIGHGLLVPPALAGTVGVVPALAGAAAAVTGVGQQLLGAVGGYAVGLVPHEGAVNLAGLMLGCALLGVGAQSLLWRRRMARREA